MRFLALTMMMLVYVCSYSVVAFADVLMTDYGLVAASQTKAALGNNGGSKDGDVIEKLIIIPATTSPGKVSIFDSSAGSEISVFPGGASSVADLKPIVVAMGARAKGDSTHTPRWLVTTGANVSVIAVGKFQ